MQIRTAKSHENADFTGLPPPLPTYLCNRHEAADEKRAGYRHNAANGFADLPLPVGIVAFAGFACLPSGRPRPFSLPRPRPSNPPSPSLPATFASPAAKTDLPLSVRSACSVVRPTRPLATGAAKWYNRAILSDGGLPLQRTEDPAQRNKRKAGAMDNYAAPAEVDGRAAGGTIRRSDGMTSREAPAGPAGRIDHVDEGKSFEGKLFCTGGRSGGLRSPSWGACVPPRGDAGRRTHKSAALAPSKRLRGGASLCRSQAEVRGRSPRPFAPSLARKPPCMRRDCAGRTVRGK